MGLKIGLAQFLQHTDVGSFYGSALTLVLVLFWIYFAMQAFLYGAELAAELANERYLSEADVADEEPELPAESKPSPPSSKRTSGINRRPDLAIETSVASEEWTPSDHH